MIGSPAAMKQLTPEVSLFAEFDNLLAAFEERTQDTTLDYEAARAKDDEIFLGLKLTIQSAEGMKNVALMMELGQRLGAMACTHVHFAEQLDTYDVLGLKYTESDEASKSQHASRRKESNSKPRRRTATEVSMAHKAKESVRNKRQRAAEGIAILFNTSLSFTGLTGYGAKAS